MQSPCTFFLTFRFAKSLLKVSIQLAKTLYVYEIIRCLLQSVLNKQLIQLTYRPNVSFFSFFLFQGFRRATYATDAVGVLLKEIRNNPKLVMFFISVQSQIWGFFNSSQIVLHQKESPGQNVCFREKACTRIL